MVKKHIQPSDEAAALQADRQRILVLRPASGLLLLFLLLVGCTPAPPPTQVEQFISAMRSITADVQEVGDLDTMPTPPLSAPGERFQVDGHEIQLYPYETAMAAYLDATRVSDDGFDFAATADGSIEATTADWVDTPHFFRQDRLIIFYLGEDRTLLAQLERVMGKQFAGGEPVPMVYGIDGQFDNGVRYRNLIIHLEDEFGSKGQLTLPPDGDGPWPVVILFSGTGPADMDASYSPGSGQAVSTNFKRIAEVLGKAGIAVLRFNKRGVLAHGDYDYDQLPHINVNQRIVDAERVIATAKAQPEVDREQLFLYGWSEGAIVATYAAHSHPEAAGLILQAPLNLSLQETLVYEYLNIGLPYLQDVIDQNGDGQLSEAELATVPAGPIWFLTFFALPNPMLMAILPLQPDLDLNNDGLINIQQELRPFVEGFIPLLSRFYANAAPSESIAELAPALAMPILLLHGERDGWIPIRAAEEIAAAAPTKVTFLRYALLGHALSYTNVLAEDSFGEMALAPIQDIVDWVLQVSKAARGADLPMRGK